MNNKVLIIGGTGGIGREMTKLLGKKYNVTSLGSKDLDITNFREMQRFFHVNSFDVVLNLSGFNYDSFMHKYDDDSIYNAYKQIDINVSGNVNLLSSCLPMMRKNQYGRIIILSSVLSTMPVPGTSVYSASKAFIDSLVKTVTLENLSKGITCNSIQLGYFDAGMAHRIPERIKRNIVSKIPLKRFGKMEELCDTIEFLMKTEYISGTSIRINGGITV
jgi:NAD(P)-dependent dehydrogenase (short-subunit alcohol dehydrogenase family)